MSRRVPRQRHDPNEAPVRDPCFRHRIARWTTAARGSPETKRCSATSTIENLNESFATVTGTFDIICECADPGCVKQIPITRDVYERVRTDATLFIIAPGHEDPGVEHIIDKQDAYHVVRKYAGVPARVAEQTDPRR